MREIKFRAMTKPPKDFGNYKFESRMVYGTGVLQDPVNTWIISNDNTKSLAVGTVKHVVKPETIGQFTGLHDYKCTEAYKDDIVEDEDGIVGTVEHGSYVVTTPAYSIRIYGYYIMWIDGDSSTTPINSVSTCKIIGNTYENSELIT